MLITEEITINAPLERVWQVFANIAAWEEWNSVCQDCCFLSGAELASGACLAFTLRPYYLPIAIQPKVTKCVPMREVVWEGQRLGVHAVHRFAFQETDGQVTITSTEEFGGPLFFLARLILVHRRLQQLTRQLLTDIKRAAEACDREARA
ncbi:MAG: SRPBCC domain-containing protein [Desulfobacca sp.]|uniref:SRPBCC domain-containing protein n=1 Tax=Desulfobacca sp. TaxID=2067990 RepID=UPI004049B1B3